MSPVFRIVLAQLLGTSLWFSANSAADDLARDWQVGLPALGALTVAVQLGFIAGTLVSALTALADRFAASRIFVVAALAGAAANAGFALLAHSILQGWVWRFAVGVALAGVYPIGMKMVVGWAPERAGATLAWLVGMLTLGTALPQAVRAVGAQLPWQAVILVSSGLACAGAALIGATGDGPHARRLTSAHPLRLGEVLGAFRIPAFRASALGYFGHMWELYAFWTLVPTLLHLVLPQFGPGSATISALAFAIIAVGAISCIVGGMLSQRIGSARVAAVALGGSAACCLVFPWLAGAGSVVAVALLVVWGMLVIADSPQFSAMSAKACPPAFVGSALAIQNSAGFAITSVSILLTTSWAPQLGPALAWVLLPGPVLGWFALRPWLRPVPNPIP